MKNILVLFIVLFVAIPVFAEDDDQIADQAVNLAVDQTANQAVDQDDNRSMAITINPNTFILSTMSEGAGISVGFEYAFLKSFSTKFELYFLAFQPNVIYGFYASYPEETLAMSFRGALEARWYPMENAIQGIFTNAGFQYQQTLGDFTIEESVYDSNTGRDDYKRTKFKGDMAVGVFLGTGYKFLFGKGRSLFVVEPALDVIWSVHLGKKAEYTGNWMLGMNGIRATINLGVAF